MKMTQIELKKSNLQQNKTSLVLILLSVVAILSSCTNGQPTLRRAKGQTSDIKESTPGDQTPKNQIKISDVTISDAASGGQIRQTTVFFSADSTQSISDICANPASSATSRTPCLCRFTWKEINERTGTSVDIQRVVESPLTGLQNFLISCNAPTVYDTEIPDGTVLKISIIPATLSSNSFSIAPFNYIKGTSSDRADFRDREGRSFVNIHRYSCFEVFERGQEVLSFLAKIQSEDGEETQTPSSTQFCALGTKSGSADGAGSNNCGHLSATTAPSAQSYYHNLFVTSKNLGDINLSNQRYTCPTTIESPVLSGDVTVDAQRRFWPLDSSFALADRWSTEFPVGIRAPSVLGDPQKDTAVETFCKTASGTGPSQAQPSTDGGIAQKCLGYAKRPNPDSTCPTFVNDRNQIEQTYRLRRFVALFPVSFEATGAPVAEPRSIDVVYVADRPVKSPDNTTLHYTMLGPKPCPFSYFDDSGVTHRTDLLQSIGAGNYATLARNTGADQYFETEIDPELGAPQYAGTNSPLWDNKDPDNLHFPNFDSRDNGPSCSALFPIVTAGIGGSKRVYLATSHISNNGVINVGGGRSIALRKVYIRPQRAWGPHYEEDTSFQACVPLSKPLRDPPLHFAKDSSGNVAWCAESYPTQNDLVGPLEEVSKKVTNASILPSLVVPFTSHVVKNAPGSSPCVNPTLPKLPEKYQGVDNNPSLTCKEGTRGIAAYSKGAGYHPDHLYIDSANATSPICSNQTCDRTAIVDLNSSNRQRFPLLAPPKDVELLLKSDPSYRCTVTWDNGGVKSGKVTPTSGCCKKTVVNLPSGGSGGPYDAAHLEPDGQCEFPDY